MRPDRSLFGRQRNREHVADPEPDQGPQLEVDEAPEDRDGDEPAEHGKKLPRDPPGTKESSAGPLTRAIVHTNGP